MSIAGLTGVVWGERGWVTWSVSLLTHTARCLPADSKSVCALTHQAQLPKCLTTRNSLSCSVSKLSGCAVWHSDWLLSKLISQQPMVLAGRCSAGRRAGSGRLEKETPAAYGSAAGGRVRHLVSEGSFSVMDELGSKQAMKRKRP